ncbi:ATP-binding protein [Pedobacter boryungensis]|uniref:ATP-binding protein n=2 Tax=Pedobacter boryungensis TaxID=869962 RepID=A0ABX2DEL7_9SPHI|nr:ATP-binding protein [Pedobacter boryungensis]
MLNACSNKSNNKQDPQNLYYQKAIKYRDLGRIDSSYVYFNRAKDQYLLQKDSLGVGKCLVNMGYIAKNEGDYFAAQEISLSAISYLDETKKDQAALISSNYNTLGLAFYQLKEYNDALRFYNYALKFINVPLYKFICLNNIAKVHEEVHNYNEAIKNYHLVLKGTVNDSIEYSRALANLSFANWLRDSNYNALPGLLKSLAIRKQQKDTLGLNHSFAQLADYYTKTNPNTALNYANNMYNVAEKLNRPDDRLEALEKLVRLSSGVKTKQYFERYRTLEDSIQIDRNKSKNQFALIRYETEKQKSDNLILQKDNTEKKYQLIKQKTILILGLIFAFFTIITSIILYNRRKQRIELETQNTIRENQLKTSKKVHDVVANGLYRIMTKLDNEQPFKDNPIVDEIEELYEKSRDISYEEKFTEQNFHEKLSRLLISFATPNTKILIVGNEGSLWNKVSAPIKYELEHILQELMVNMKKHSSANDVLIRFEQEGNQMNISYSDNGVGMPADLHFNNGLTNTGNRINSINGVITFESNNGKGLKIKITFPLT